VIAGKIRTACEGIRPDVPPTGINILTFRAGP
jgi:hypothetical protein